MESPVAQFDTKAAPAWQVVADAALDALWFVWLDPTGTLRFRSVGRLAGRGALFIGCPPPDADPGDVWLSGLSTIEATAAGDAVRNSIRAYSAGTTWAPAITDGVSIGTLRAATSFDVERVVPDRATSAGRTVRRPRRRRA